MKEALVRIGLSENEVLVYLSLIKLGESKVHSIVEKTDINRTNVYDCLERLISKGLVSYIIKNNKKHFRASKPNKIIRYLEEKEAKIREEKKKINLLIPELNKITPFEKSENVQVFEGKEGLKSALEIILESKKDIFSYGSRGNMAILDHYMANYVRRMSKKKVNAKIIFNDEENRKPFKYKFGEIRYLPKDYKIATETMICGEEVVIFIFTEKPIAIHIKSKTLSSSYKKYFELLWKIAKKV